MSSITILNVQFFTLLFGGLFIFCAFAPYSLRRIRRREFSEAFWLALAISLTWLGVAINRLYVLIALEGPHFGWSTEWLRNHWAQTPTLLPMMAGMLIFMRVATHKHSGEFFWISATLFILSLAFMLSAVPDILTTSFFGR